MIKFDIIIILALNFEQIGLINEDFKLFRQVPRSSVLLKEVQNRNDLNNSKRSQQYRMIKNLFDYIGNLTLSCKSRISEHVIFNIALASRLNTTKVVQPVTLITRSLSLYLKVDIRKIIHLLIFVYFLNLNLNLNQNSED